MTPTRANKMAEAIGEAEVNEESEEDRHYTRVSAPKSPSQVYSVRIPVDRLEELRRLAHERGLQPTALIRRWVLERLDGESKPHHPPTIVVVHSEQRSSVGHLKNDLRRLDDEIGSVLALNSFVSPSRTER